MAPARSRSGNHAVTIRLQMGKEGASKMPSSRRSENKNTNVPANPCNMVANDHSAQIKAYRYRGRMRSTSQPPGTCRVAYAQPKADKIQPRCLGSKLRSFDSAGAATEMLLRS